MSAATTAEVSSVPAAYRGKILTLPTKLLENGAFLVQFVLFWGVTLVPAILGGLAATGTLWPAGWEPSFVPVLVGLAASGGLAWVAFGRVQRNPWSSGYTFQKTVAELSQRPDPLVDPRNAEAIFTEVIPRRNWGQISLQNADDLGLLVVDAERRQLLFEGDAKRYRVPAAAVVSCEVELMNPGAESNPHGVPIGLTVLTIRDHLGQREIPFRPVRTVGGDPLGNNYYERAEALQRRIAALLAG
jgi:hypothetical protein